MALEVGYSAEDKLPGRDIRPYLDFRGITHTDSRALAVFTDPNGRAYRFSAGEVARALDFEDIKRENCLRGEVTYDLPYFQLAQHQLRYRQNEHPVRNFFRNICVPAAQRAGVAAVGLWASWGILSHLEDQAATKPFNQAVRWTVSGQEFAVDLEKRTAASGSPGVIGYSWDFSVSPHRACEVLPDKRKKSVLARWLLPTYTRECKEVGKWPAGSPARQLYVPALTAFLQVAKPQDPPSLEQVRRALQSQNDSAAIKP